MFLGENPMFYVLRRGAGLQWLEILVICNAPNDGSRNNATPLSGGSGLTGSIQILHDEY